MMLSKPKIKIKDDSNLRKQIDYLVDNLDQVTL